MAMYAETVTKAVHARRAIEGSLWDSVAMAILALAVMAKAIDSDLDGQRTIHSSAQPVPATTDRMDRTMRTTPSGGAELHSNAKGMIVRDAEVTTITARVIPTMGRA